MPHSRLGSFYALAATQLFSLIGSRLSGVTIGLWLYAHTGATSPLLTAAFFAEFPAMALGSFTGLLADRWDKRHIIMLGDAGQAVGTGLLLFTIASGRFALWHLYAVMLLQGAFLAVQRPASESAITLLAPDSLRDRANGLMQMGFPLAGFIAPVLAGLLYRSIGLMGVLMIDLITFVAAIAIVRRLAVPHAIVEGALNASFSAHWRALWAGWRWLVQQRGLLGLAILIALVDFLTNGPLEMAIPYFSATTRDARAVGFLLGAMSLGALAGAATIAIVGQVRRRIRTILVGYLFLGALFLLFGIARQPLWLGIAVFALMFPLPMVGAVFSSIIQAKAPLALQGRVFAATGQAFVLGTPLSFLLTGVLVDRVFEPLALTSAWHPFEPIWGRAPGAGMGLLLGLVGLLILGATALASAWTPIRCIERDLPDSSNSVE